MITVKMFNKTTSTFKSKSYTIYLCGQLQYNENSIFSAKGISEQLGFELLNSDKNKFSNFFKNNFLLNVNGCFSIVIVSDDKVWLAVDMMRSLPLFVVKIDPDNLIITDKLGLLDYEYEVDSNNLEEFISCGIVFDNRTVYKKVTGLMAGEIIEVSDYEIKSKRYFKNTPSIKSYLYDSQEDFYKHFDTVFNTAFENLLLQSPKVNNWVVPLSGGHDSRIIVNYLYKLGVKKVKCFTYGIPGNQQASISKRVSEALGYQWYFVEYTEDKWDRLFKTRIIDDFISYTFNGVSTPHFQDFLAVYELKKENIISEGDIILAGHTVINSRFQKNNSTYKTKQDAVRHAYETDIRITPSKQFNKKAILTLINHIEDSTVKKEDILSYLFWQERHSKFTLNSLDTYRFFDLDARLPLWDKAIVHFWLSYPANQRTGRELLYESESKGLLVDDLVDIPYADQNKGLTQNKQKFKQILLKIIPQDIIICILRVFKRKIMKNEGLNQIFSKQATSVQELLDPVDDYPEKTKSYFNNILKRYPYQVNENFLSTLVTVRKEILNK